MDNERDERPLENLRSGGYTRREHVAEDLVGSGQCMSYDEAYAVLNGMKSGDVLQTFRGFVRKQ